MIRTIYAIRDLVADGFLHPMVDNSDGEAIRNFEHACLNNNSLFFTHTYDYDLYKIGEYDTEKGTINAFDIPQHLFSGSQVRKEIENE